MDKQNILLQGLNSIEPTKNLLNENQLSQQVSYLESFQKKEGSPNILNGFADTNVSIISEQTLQKRVRSQIVRRNVHQTMNFQNVMCQVVNQNQDQHAIISYQDQDNNINSIQHISSKKPINQIVQQQNQKTFQQGKNCSQISLARQEGQIEQKQIIKEVISDNQINCEQLSKLQENSFFNQQKEEQQHENQQSLKHEQITGQVNFDQQENIHKDKNCLQYDSNKKEGYIQNQGDIQEENSNYQVNYLQLKKEDNIQSPNQEQTENQENIYQQEISDIIDFKNDKNCSQNDLSKKESSIEQMQAKKTKSNFQINSLQIKELQSEEKINENLLKDQQQHHNKNSPNNNKQANDQEKSDEKENTGEQISLIKENDKQVYDKKETTPLQNQIELKSTLKQENISDQQNKITQDRSIPILNNPPTKKEIQSVENQQKLIINQNFKDLNDLTQKYSSQLKEIFNKIEGYQFKEFEKSEELDQSAHQIKKQWNQQIFEDVNDKQVQSQIFQSQKSKIFEILLQKQFCLCKILNSNQNQDLIVGFINDESENFDEYIFQITYNLNQQDIDSQEVILKTLGFEFDYIKLEQENISILILKKNDFLLISDKFEQLVQFKSNIQSIQNYYEINTQYCQECKNCANLAICNDQSCFKNVKSRILSFLQNKKYFYCEYTNKKINGIIFQLKKEVFEPEYLNYLYKIIYNFQENNQISYQNTCQYHSICFWEDIQQKKQNFSQEEHVKQIINIDLVLAYSFKDYKVQEKQDQNEEKINLNPNYQMKWDFQVFDTLNKNQVSDTFLKLQNEVFQILKSQNYFLCKCFVSNQNEDIFLGYYEENEQIYIDYIFVILYNPNDSEIFKYKLVEQFNEELNHFKINRFTHILILSKDAFLQIYNNYEYVSQIKIEWSKDYFEKINKDKFINLQKCCDCENCKKKQECENKTNFINFQQSKNLIFKKLIKKNYYICEYLNKGGEGFVFQGYRQSIYEKQEVVFKILFGSNQEEIKNEIQIMNMFDCHLNIIKFIDHIQIKDNIHVLVLEKCKFSLKGELELIQQSRKFPLKKLLQMIFNLLDGLVQFRIYNILHLDIKPQNILLNNSDQYVYTDFGMSSLQKNNKQVDIKGCTPFYASPEQINNQQNIDYLSDVYSLGKTFEIILKIFKKVQQQKYQKITNNLMKVVNEKMIENKQESRFNCLELRNEFFKYILEQNESIKFLNYYIKQIQQVLNSYPYDKNKEISYFFKISLSYKSNILDYWKQSIQQNIQSDTNQIQQNIALSLSNVSDCYKNLGDNKKALEYLLESLQMRKQIFKENHPDIAESLNNVGNCYQNLGDNKKALEYLLESHKRIKQIFKENHPDIASSLNNVGSCYLYLGDNKKALEYLLESHQMRKQIFKENHPDIAESLNNVGTCYQNIGDNKKALEYYLESLKMIKQIFKENHPDIASSLNNVGSCYLYLGDNKKALEYLLESHQMRKQIFKENHPQIATSLNNVGCCYRNLGDNKKALEYQLESLQIFKQIFKENHPNIAGSLSSVGQCYENLGDNKKALEYQLESLQMRKQIFKENHPQIATSLNNVGCCYRNLGDNKKALEYQLESLQMKKQIFKENHPDIAISLNNVGLCYQNFGDNKNALEYQLESLQMRKQIFKENHPDIATSLNNVGLCFKNLGDNKKALEYKLESLQMRKQIFKENHPDIAESLNNVGTCYQNLGDNKKALEYQLESLQMIKQIFKENHPSIAKFLNNVGSCYKNLGNNKKALEYLLESHQMRKQIFKENHPDIALSLNNVGICYQNIGDNKKALEYQLESLKMIKQIFKENHPDIAESLNNVGTCYQNLGDNKKALEYQLESLQIFKQIFKENHPDIAASLNNVGSCYAYLGDNKKALEYLLESLQMIKQIFKENHPDIAMFLNNVGLCYKNLGDNKKALEYLLESLQMRKQIFKENQSDIIEIFFNISSCFFNLGDNEMFKEYYQEFIQMLPQYSNEQTRLIVTNFFNKVLQGYQQWQ